jgi:cell division protein FtsI/penicillin-binding protein 2
VSLIERRIGFLFAVFLVLLLLAAGRSLQLGVLSGSRLAEAAATQQVVTEHVPALRGAIVDRHGVELAVAEPADDISATPYLIKDPAGVAEKLAPLLDRTPAELLEQLTRRDTGFVYLAKGVPGARGERVRKLGIEGIQLDPVQRRLYPHRWLASQILGTTGAEPGGGSGLEYRYDAQLRGTDGQRRRVRDGVGDAVSVRDLRPARNGATLQLTLDAAIQEKVEEVLAGVGATYSPKGATAIVMDPRSSEVLALANWPRVDANNPGGAPGYATQNRAVGQTYEPGSTFKAATVAAALQDGVVRPDTAFDLPPTLPVADRIIKESHDRGPATLTTAEILAESSNVGTVKIGQALGARRLDAWIRRLGFGRPTGIDLPGEERGLLLPLEKWSGSTIGNVPIGQGLAVTPMQMAQLYAAIANGGVLRTPRVVRHVGEATPGHKPGRRVMSGSTAAALRSMLEGVLAPGGTASEVRIPGYALAGKTGTAEKVVGGGYSKSAYVASFVGFAPAEDPELLISVMVDEPKGGIYGGQVAAPAFGKIASFALPYLEIPPG